MLWPWNGTDDSLSHSLTERLIIYYAEHWPGLVALTTTKLISLLMPMSASSAATVRIVSLIGVVSRIVLLYTDLTNWGRLSFMSSNVTVTYTHHKVKVTRSASRSRSTSQGECQGHKVKVTRTLWDVCTYVCTYSGIVGLSFWRRVRTIISLHTQCKVKVTKSMSRSQRHSELCVLTVA